MRPQITEFLARHGLTDVPHSGRTLLDHLRGTAEIASRLTDDQDIIDACAVHSIYGTEFFVPGRLVSRQSVREVISPRAESLAWLFCTMRRATLVSDHMFIILRDDTRFDLSADTHSALMLMVRANRDEGNQSYFSRVAGRSARKDGFFIDTAGEISRCDPSVDLRIMPKFDAPILPRVKVLSDTESGDVAEIIQGVRLSAHMAPSQVFREGGSGLTTSPERTSFNFQPDARFEPTFLKMRQALLDHLPGFSGVEIDPIVAGTQGLYYQKGGIFSPHADNTIRSGRGFVTNTPARQIVTLLYLSAHSEDPSAFDEFSGGELYFPKIRQNNGHMLSIRPSRGEMLIFPANLWYTHGVSLVTAGHRMALSRWWQVRNLGE